MAETWRVVLADGSVREVIVTEDAGLWTAHCEGCATFSHASPTLAVRALVRGFLGASFDVREILSPGEPTRAELVAFERGRDAADEAGARAMRAAALRDAVADERERCARVCDEVAAEPVMGEWDDDAEAYRRGRRAGARECAEKCRAGGV